MFKGMVPPGRFQATCVSGTPPGPNRVLQGQQKQNEAQEKKELLYHEYICPKTWGGGGSLALFGGFDGFGSGAVVFLENYGVLRVPPPCFRGA